MSLVLNDGTRTLTIYAKSITATERWQQRSLATGPTSNPVLIDIGKSEDMVEIMFVLKSNVDVDKFKNLFNPVTVDSSTYPEIPAGSTWRIAEREIERKPGRVSTWDCRIRLRREYS